MSEPTPLRDYRSALQRQLSTGLSTEHSHRAALQVLIEELTKLGVTNEPKRSACGAPDFTVWRSEPQALTTIGHVEAKDVGTDLAEEERGEQLARYRAALPNLVLTDYLEFRWYVDGKLETVTRIADVASDGSVIRRKNGEAGFLRALEAFAGRRPPGVNRPHELAERMARLTHLIRDVIVESFDQGAETKLVKDLRQAFTDILIPDLSVSAFADMYAQTIAYGLFAARANHDGASPFRRHDAAYEIPRSNPFLRKLFAAITGPELDAEPYVGLVDDLTQLLADTNMVSVFAEFGTRGPREDPVVHFYETFLNAYDPTLRELRGVYYTPEPIVSYIVRSVDRLLAKSFDCPAGLGDQSSVTFESEADDGEALEVEKPRVLILDPACGTGTFLYAVIDLIRQRFAARDDAGKWAGFARDQLVPRLFGFELLMAPYAVAHLKLALQLSGQDMPASQREEWAYEFESAERLSIYLTNTLEEAVRKSEVLLGSFISEEANAATEVKRELPILVVLGNPPYSGHSANRGEWITDLVRDYSRNVPGLDKPAQGKWLQDDYVKFIRFGQWRIERSGTGILAFITNHAYLDNPTFRGMRKQLMETFDDIYVLNLHGNSNRREVSPDGTPDKNVFDIRQGVAISLFIRSTGSPEPATVHHADLWGERIDKYDWLAEHDFETTDWAELKPTAPRYLFIPEDEDVRVEYERGWSIPEILSLGSDPAPGIVTTHDSFAISWSKDDAIEKVERFLETKDEEEAREIWKLCGQSQWNYETAKEALAKSDWRDELVPVMYRPFDSRVTVWDSNVAVHRRERVMRHMLAGPNIALLTTRSVEIADGFQHAFCTSTVATHHTVSSKEVNFVFPLYLYPEGVLKGSKRVPNIAPVFIEALKAALGLEFISEGRGDLVGSVGPEDVLAYVYAVLYSNDYRERYEEFLRKDFPRIPLVRDLKIFQELVPLGHELLQLHSLDTKLVGSPITNFPARGSNIIEAGFPRYAPATDSAEPGLGSVQINKEQHFGRVPQDVWEFKIGGYRILDRWLRDRRGMTLSHADVTRFEQIVVAISETLRVMDEVAKVTSWPPANADQMLADLEPLAQAGAERPLRTRRSRPPAGQ